MPELRWNEYDFLECFGVLPQLDEDTVFYFFKVELDNLILEINICHYESLVEIILSQKDNITPFLCLSFLVRNEIRFVNEKNVSFIEFSDCIITKSYDSELFDKEKYPNHSNFQIHGFPNFKLISC
jgi:hypothetical protein